MDNLQKKIADKAYQLFLARGGVHGYHLQDWAKAEKEIRAGSLVKTETKKTIQKPAAKSANKKVKK